MNIEELRDYCLSFDGVTEKMPFQQFKAAQSICAFYVSGHIFCYFDMNRKYWISIHFHGDVNDRILRSLIQDSYEIVKQQYKRKIRSL